MKVSLKAKEAEFGLDFIASTAMYNLQDKIYPMNLLHPIINSIHASTF